MSDTRAKTDAQATRVSEAELAAFCFAALSRAGADKATAEAATRAMIHGSIHGIDSHGVRLLNHYVRVIEGGRVNPAPHMSFDPGRVAVATLNGDHGHGALATSVAMERAIALAKEAGTGSVAIRNSSHFGPAGFYALQAAEAGLIGLAVCNSDAFVRLHGGATPFHGTNPIAMAAPVDGQRPWLLDMATSAIPYNRIMLHRSLGTALPADVASAETGADTTDAMRASMLVPLGGAFSYKGAGLAGLVEIFSAMLTGMTLSAAILPMEGEDVTTPRCMGAFVMAFDPEAFVGREDFARRMKNYVDSLRSSASADGQTVMAPGDREWAEAERRRRGGIPLDPQTIRRFAALRQRFDLPAFGAPTRETPQA